MNSMTAALKQAGAPVPVLMKRIWLWLKDHLRELFYSGVSTAYGPLG